MSIPNAPSPLHAGPAIGRIGRFRIERELGRGAIGLVYLGHDPVIDRSVAIKTFSPRLTPHERKQYEQQFINEARAAGRLSHPNIVTIFEASSESGTTYIAMEHLQGRELSKLIDEGKRFSADETAAIVWKVADALDYAHRNGVVHRDIKPANIFLIADNQPKVVDFGIARAPNRVSDEGSSDAAYTLYRNNLLGTPNYMSPEQATGRPVDLRTDIYSLGAVMYEMLTGSKPFKARDTTQLLHHIAHKMPAAPHEVDASVPVDLSQIAMKAMNKREEKRYQSAEEMAQDIRRSMSRQKRSRRRAKRERIGLGPDNQASPASDPLFRLAFLTALLALAVAGMRILRG
jgi:serine/threonine-protein kinase